VLTSPNIAAGRAVSLKALIPRTGTLSAAAVQIGDTVTAQETFDINLRLNGGADAFAEINQAERVYSGSSQTQSNQADSSVFTYGISGNNAVLLSEPSINVTYATGSSASTTLG